MRGRRQNGNMRYVFLKNCERCKEEQWYIQSTLAVWKYLSAERQKELQELMLEVSDSSQEATALFSVLVRGVPPEAAGAADGVQVRRLYVLREQFYNRFPI